ncbi:MAG: hypothetical protein LC637_14120 [Xanthomonadaceae bacterium]|nr:hypothetical protein [Xanthomonadaceae bacterium]
MNGVIKWLLLASLLMVLVGCAAPGSVSLDSNLESAQLRHPALSCAFEFDGISDSIDQRRVQGYGYSGIDLENLSTYIDKHIGSWLPDAFVNRQSMKLEVALYRLYSENKSTATFFNVVFRVRAGTSEPEYLRGRYSSITWFGTPEEFQISMQRAVNEALTELHGRLEERCEETATY